MLIRRSLAVLAAAGLMATPALAADPAAKLSIAPAGARAAAPVGQARLGAEISTGTLISIGFLAAALALVIALNTGSDGDDSPSSP